MSYPLVILETMMAERRADEVLAVMGDDEFRAFYERTARPLWAYLSRISVRTLLLRARRKLAGILTGGAR